MSTDAPSNRGPRWMLGCSILLAAVGCAAIVVLGVEPGTLSGAAWAILNSGLPSAAYVAGAAGLGVAVSPILFGRGSARDPAIATAIGLALMLSASHALGCLGLLSGRLGRAIAIGLVLAGCARLAFLARGASGRARISPWGLACAPLLLLGVLAACSPPGWLWDCEFGGYDALSYHLQLPQEWIAQRRIRPIEHNVYSFLPSAMESAFVHVGVMLGASGPKDDGQHWGLVANDGRGLLAAQFLHLWLGVVAVMMLGRLASASGRALGNGDDANTSSSLTWPIGACVAGVPWVLVTATLAYNEMGVLALGAGAAMIALDAKLSPVRRAVAAGFLVGSACLCKPTALIFVGVPVGVLLLGLAPARWWAWMVLAGSFAGLLTLAPWLIRNAVTCGNPVFPFASGVLGKGWWTDEQHARFAGAHGFSGSMIERVGLLVGIARDSRDAIRGYANLQWGTFALAPLAAPIVALTRSGSRRVAVLLTIGLACQLAAWLTTTHLQSRFLMPTLIMLAPLLGIGLRPARAPRADAARGVATLACAAVGIACVATVFGMQRGGRPLALVGPGPAIYSGEHEADLDADANPEVTLNLAYRGRRVFLLGDATPLYIATPPIYSTTWDASSLTRAIAESPDDPGAWIESIRNTGADLALINLAELDRLRRSGWLDPALTEDRIRVLGERLGRPVQAWPSSGRYLFDLTRSTP